MKYLAHEERACLPGNNLRPRRPSRPSATLTLRARRRRIIHTRTKKRTECLVPGSALHHSFLPRPAAVTRAFFSPHGNAPDTRRFLAEAFFYNLVWVAASTLLSLGCIAYISPAFWISPRWRPETLKTFCSYINHMSISTRSISDLNASACSPCETIATSCACLSSVLRALLCSLRLARAFRRSTPADCVTARVFRCRNV